MTPSNWAREESDHLRELHERDERIRRLEETVALLRAEADRFVHLQNAAWPEGNEDLKAQILLAQARVVQLTGDLMDFHTVVRHCSVIYDHVSGGKIGKPMTYPSVVIEEMEYQQAVEFEEWYAERREWEINNGPVSFIGVSQANEALHVAELTMQNRLRCHEVYHPIDAWSPADWACAFAGEAGECANLVKKMRRVTEDPACYPKGKLLAIADEVADTVLYGDLLLQRLGMSLEQAIRRKFNAVSARVRSNVRI